jgi:hypothetical protein
MKTWMITLPFLLAAGLATATEPAAQSGAAVAVEQAVPAKPVKMKRHKVQRHKIRHLPRGDLRHCLELKDNPAIIACAEGRR